MRDSGGPDEACPFSFNFNPATFGAGDCVSYRVPERFGDMPFVGTLVEVGADYVVISPNDPMTPDKRMRGTRESRPVPPRRPWPRSDAIHPGQHAEPLRGAARR